MIKITKFFEISCIILFLKIITQEMKNEFHLVESPQIELLIKCTALLGKSSLVQVKP